MVDKQPSGLSQNIRTQVEVARLCLPAEPLIPALSGPDGDRTGATSRRESLLPLPEGPLATAGRSLILEDLRITNCYYYLHQLPRAWELDLGLVIHFLYRYREGGGLAARHVLRWGRELPWTAFTPELTEAALREPLEEEFFLTNVSWQGQVHFVPGSPTPWLLDLTLTGDVHLVLYRWEIMAWPPVQPRDRFRYRVKVLPNRNQQATSPVPPSLGAAGLAGAAPDTTPQSAYGSEIKALQEQLAACQQELAYLHQLLSASRADIYPRRLGTPMKSPGGVATHG